MSKNLSELSGRKKLENNLFDKLNKIEASGDSRNEDLAGIAKEFLIGDAITYGTASFYDFLKEENAEKKVHICNGSTCMLAGTQEILKDNLTQFVQENEIGEMCCLGRCHENSAFSYNGNNYSALSKNELESLFLEGFTKADKYQVEANPKAILTEKINDCDHYYSLLKNVLNRDSSEILEEIKSSGLRGRGGAGFPMGLKLEFAAKVESDQKYIICNADEGDPGAYSDRYLLEERPHAVLFGMMVAAYGCGADTGILYIRAEYPESIACIENAINELVSKKIIGNKIFGTDFNFKFKIIKAAGAYICGEETALINSIEGQRPEVRVRPPYPAQEGLFNKPTVVNNVETFASLHYIIEKGGTDFAKIGRGKSTGTKLVCLDGFFNRPGVYEVEMGTKLSDIIYKMGSGFTENVKALHIGGPLGGIVPINRVNDLTLDFESFSENGFLLGHASIVSIPEKYPLIEYLKHLFQFTAHESCGKCFPCRLGATRGFELLEKASVSDYKIDLQLFNDLLETMEIGSLCALGGGLPLGIYNAMEYFKDELNNYFIKV